MDEFQEEANILGLYVFYIETSFFYGPANYLPSHFVFSPVCGLLPSPKVRTLSLIYFIVEPFRYFNTS
jgi:hypothetical protein